MKKQKTFIERLLWQRTYSGADSLLVWGYFVTAILFDNGFLSEYIALPVTFTLILALLIKFFYYEHKYFNEDNTLPTNNT